MLVFVVFRQNTEYGMRIGDWSSDVCSAVRLVGAGVAAVVARIGGRSGRALVDVRLVGTAVLCCDCSAERARLIDVGIVDATARLIDKGGAVTDRQSVV